MSAFICDDMHINAIVTYAVDKQVSIYEEGNGHTYITDANAEEIGRTLLSENVRSVNHRYNESEDAGDYKFERFETPLTAVEAIKACNCLDYQSCETDDWKTTRACAILNAVIAKAHNDLPGYDNAPWEITPNSIGKLKYKGGVLLSPLAKRK